MKESIRYVAAGFISGSLFCLIFSIQWFILDARPVIAAYIPPSIVGFVSGVIINYLKTKWEEAAAEKERERLKAIIEISGAVCHETNQPLQVIIGKLELLQMDIEYESDIYNKVTEIRNESERIAEILRKLQKINTYKTKKYVSSKIIDIDASSAP